MQTITAQEYDKIEKEVPDHILFFTSDSCPPCITAKTVLEPFETDLVPIYEIQCDLEMGFAHLFRVSTAPTIIIIRNGVETARLTGWQSSHIATLISVGSKS